MQWLKIAVAVAVVAVVYCYRLDRPLLWGDEADTGVLARNVLRSGYPTAVDGRNVAFYGEGSQLNRELVSKKIPWVSFYLGALSLAAFGDHTAGLRVLFAVVGLLSFFPLYAVLKTRVRCPEFVTALALVAPQTVLFHRNARYYSLLTLLEALLVWHLSREFASTRMRFLTAALILTVMFHTHPLAAGCASLTLVLFCLLTDRRSLWLYAAATGVGGGLWLAWYLALGPYLTETPLTVSLIGSDFGLWCEKFAIGLANTFLGADTVGCLPVVLWLAALVWLFVRDRGAFWQLWRQPLPAFVLLGFLVQALVMAALLGTESAAHHSYLRYMPHLVVLSLVSLFVVLNAAIARTWIYLAASVGAVAFNPLTLSFWLSWLGLGTVGYDRPVPVTWVAPVYAEIISPPETLWDTVIGRLRREADAHPGNDLRLMSLPPWTQEVMVFYLGDRYFVLPYLDSPKEELLQVLKARLGDGAFGRLLGRPQWIIDFLGLLPATPPGYVLGEETAFYQLRPDEGSRPELTRHSFLQREPQGVLRVYRPQEVRSP